MQAKANGRIGDPKKFCMTVQEQSEWSWNNEILSASVTIMLHKPPPTKCEISDE